MRGDRIRLMSPYRLQTGCSLRFSSPMPGGGP